MQGMAFFFALINFIHKNENSVRVAFHFSGDQTGLRDLDIVLRETHRCVNLETLLPVAFYNWDY